MCECCVRNWRLHLMVPVRVTKQPNVAPTQKVVRVGDADSGAVQDERNAKAPDKSHVLQTHHMRTLHLPYATMTMQRATRIPFRWFCGIELRGSVLVGKHWK